MGWQWVARLNPGSRIITLIIILMSAVCFSTIAYIIVVTLQHQAKSNARSYETEYRKNESRDSTPTEFRIRILAVADDTMVDFYQQDLAPYISKLLSLADLAFAHPSLGQEGKIKLKVVHSLALDTKATQKLEIGAEIFVFDHFDDTSPKFEAPSLDSEDLLLLDNFCAWQQKFQERTRMEYDAAILFTKRDHYQLLSPVSSSRSSSGGKNALNKLDSSNITRFTLQQLLGIAFHEGVCKLGENCAVVQDPGLDSAWIVAHEIGHLLSLSDDQTHHCLFLNTLEHFDNPIEDEASFIMQSSREHNKDSPVKWSLCSRILLKQFLSRHSGCLRAQSPVQKHPESNSADDHEMTGLEYDGVDPHFQCQRWLHNHPSSSNRTQSKSSPCPGPLSCHQLSCTLGGAEEGCVTLLNFRWKDGTPCGQSSWCMSGLCVKKNETMAR